MSQGLHMALFPHSVRLNSSAPSAILCVLRVKQGRLGALKRRIFGAEIAEATGINVDNLMDCQRDCHRNAQ